MSVVSIVGPPGLLTGGLRDASGRFVRPQLTTGRTGDGETVTLPAETVDLIRAMEMREEYGSYDKALHAAVRGGNENDVSILLGQGASPDTDSRSDSSYENSKLPVLYFAAKRGHERIVDVLLAAGARIDGPSDAYGGASMTPIGIASENGHLNVVNRLIAAGARVDFPDNFYPSPLRRAARKGHADVMRALLAAGAEAGDKKNEMFNEALIAAVQADNEHNVSISLGMGASPDAESGRGKSALMIAAYSGHERIVHLLLAAGARIDSNDTAYIDASRSSLKEASTMGHLNVVNRLIAAGARINFPGGGEVFGPLSEAAQRGHIDVVRALIAAGADVNGKIMIRYCDIFRPPYGVYEWGPFHNLDVTAELIRHATNVNYKDPKTGNTPLIAAAFTGISDIVRMLLAHGADARGRDNRGRDAVFAATDEMRKRLSILTPHDVSEYRKIIEMIKDAQR